MVLVAPDIFTVDVVIAADGMHSALRQSLFGDVTAHDTGFDAWMWWAPPADIDPEQASAYDQSNLVFCRERDR